jgi:tetratricopeptide (TPR) repeat protein
LPDSSASTARATAPEDLVTLRMRLESADAMTAASELGAFADATADPIAAAVALTEGALRLIAAAERSDAEALLRRAAELCPEVPVAAFVGWHEARLSGDAEAERYWLRATREAQGESADGIFDQIREALSMPAEQAAEKGTLLGEAHRLRPADYGLRVLAEQAAPEAVPPHAEWQMARAAEPGADAASMALEAAMAFEAAGDVERAATAVRRASELGEGVFAPVFARRYALRGHGVDEAVARLAARYETGADPVERRELCAELASLELDGRKDRERCVRWLQAALQGDPSHLPTLRWLERILGPTDDPELCEAVALDLARALDGHESAAHAMMATRLMEGRGQWQHAREAVEIAYRHKPAHLWSLRQIIPHAQAKGDHGLVQEASLELAERTTDPMEQATLLLRAAQATMATGNDEAARELLGRAQEQWPEHFMVRHERARFLERTAEAPEAATAFEQLGAVSHAPEEKAAALYRAATLWLSLDDGDGRDEGRRLLSAVAEIDPGYADTFDRLKAIYVASGAKTELAELLDARLQTITDPAQRVEMEVLRGRVLAEAGAAAEARAALEAAIAANPGNPEALSAYADVCAAEQDWTTVEQTLIDLGRLVADRDGQVAVYLRLGELYGEHLPNPERAELAYQEVLALEPGHAWARAKLVDLYLAQGDTTRAFEQQTALIDAAQAPSEQCEHVVRLAEIYEQAGDLKQAEATLVKARRTFPKEASALAALFQHYQRNGQGDTADKMLERAAAEVRRGLGAGRFEPELFAMLGAVSELRGQSDAAEVATATLTAIEGAATGLRGFGPAVASDRFDPWVAPEAFGDGFRTLLRTSGGLLELAEPLDLAALRTKPLGPAYPQAAELTWELGDAYGIKDLQLLCTNAVGMVCVPACTEPPQLIFGTSLLEAAQPEPREFLIHRALKLLQTKTAALARTAPIDLWPLLAAYLKLHSPSFNPQGVDQRRVAQYHQRMAPHARPPDPKVSRLAAEVIAHIGNRASSLSAAAAAWGSRAALLAMGDPYVALMAVAWTTGSPQGPPELAEERIKWISRKAEARDLVVFLVSEEYEQARAALRGA